MLNIHILSKLKSILFDMSFTLHWRERERERERLFGVCMLNQVTNQVTNIDNLPCGRLICKN